MRGIDVSEFQGEINWDAVEGVDFVMIRAGYGKGTPDKHFRRNIEHCNRLGIKCGAYWFSYARTVNMARKEAEACLAAIAGYKLDMPVGFDWEYDSHKNAVKKGVRPTRELVTAMFLAFAEVIKAAGYTPMNYTNPDYLARFFDETTLEYPLWLAEWGGKITYSHPKADIWIWQYGLTKVPGIGGDVDGNEGFKSLMEEDDMSYEQFKEYMQRYEAERAALEPGAWSQEARDWAEQRGIIRGDENGNKRYKSYLTREEYVVTEYRQAIAQASEGKK